MGSENLTWTLEMTRDEGAQLTLDWEKDMERFNEYVKEKGYTEKELQREKNMYWFKKNEIKDKYEKEVEETGIRAFPI